MESSLHRAQQILEQNEDTIAAIVENLQLGRLDDCARHYCILQNNLVALAKDLDNIPGEGDPYTSVLQFPDEIMRKDVLDDLLPHDARQIPDPPLVPPCTACAEQLLTAQQCRIDLNHVGLNSKFTDAEREDFLRVASEVSKQHTQNLIKSVDGKRSKKPHLYQ